MPFEGELYSFQQEIVDRMLERQKFLVAADLGRDR